MIYVYFGKDSPFYSKKKIWGLLLAVLLLTCLTGCQSKEQQIEREFAAKNSKMVMEIKEYQDAMKLLIMAMDDRNSAIKNLLDADRKGENKENYSQQYDLARSYLIKIEHDVTVKRGKALTELYETKRYGEQNEIILRKTWKDYDVLMYGISKNILQMEEDARKEK